MRITVETLDEFCSELREHCDRVRHRTVRWAVVRRPEQPEAVTFEVGCAATAILDQDDGGERHAYLLEYVAALGIDTRKGQDGSELAARLTQQLTETCDDLVLKLRPGKIELV